LRYAEIDKYIEP